MSTTDQDAALQLDALHAAGCYRIWTDTMSGSLEHRPELAKLLDQLRPGDTLVVWRLDRLGRSIRNLIDQLQALPIVFTFSSPVHVIDVYRRSHLIVSSPMEIQLPARLLHRDFTDELALTADAPFNVRVDHPLIDIPLVHDQKVEQAAAPATQERAVLKSRARAHVTLLMISLWLTSASFALFVVGLALSFVDANLGAGLGIPGMLLFPIGAIMLLIAVIRRLIIGRRSQRLAR